MIAKRMKKTFPKFKFCGFTFLLGALETSLRTGYFKKQFCKNVFFLACLLMLNHIGISDAWAQSQKPIYLGTVAEVASTFREKAQAKERKAQVSDYQVRYKLE